MLYFLIEKLISGIVIIISILLAVAFVTLLERKIMGFMQRRRGPNVTGIHGILQPIADGVKLILKETILPFKANTFLFFFSPVLTF
jgi:NADH:ubiquinone oxidoreductase subunit H